MGQALQVGSQGFNVLEGIGTLTSGLSNYANTTTQGTLQAQQLNAEANMADTNAILMQYSQKQARERGKNESLKGVIERKYQREQAQDVIGAQKASMSAQGVDASSGSGLEALADSAFKAARDEDAMRYQSNVNEWQARMDEYNAKIEENNLHYQAQLLRQGAKTTTEYANRAAFNSLASSELTAGNQFASSEAARMAQAKAAESVIGKAKIVKDWNYFMNGGK